MPEERTKTAERVLRRLFSLAAKICLKHSVKIQDVSELLRSVMLDTAKNQVEKTGEAASVSKLSVMTGLQRRDVSRLLAKQSPLKKAVNLNERIIGQWSYDKKYLDKKGNPRKLNYQGKDSEFAKLVKSINQDMSPYTILFELERAGNIKKSDEVVELLGEVYDASEDEEVALEYLFSDTDDLITAVEENIYQKQEIPNLHIKTEFDNIPIEDAEEVRAWLLKQGSAFHEKVRKYLSAKDRDFGAKQSSGSERARVALGAFSRIELVEPTDPTAANRKDSAK